jgi:hypothetical protein
LVNSRDSVAPALKGSSFVASILDYANSGDLGVATRTAWCGVGIDINNLTELSVPAGQFREDSGATYSGDEVALWRDRYYSNSYMRIKGDVFEGSPENITDIIKDAEAQIISPEPYVDIREEDGALGSTYGFKMRDAAFLYLITKEDKYLSAAKKSLVPLLSSTYNTKTFFDTACFRVLDGTAPKDAYFGHAALIARLATTYDYLRSGLSENERLIIENALRKYVYFFAAHFDWGVGGLFPNRLNDDYSVRGRNADDKATAWPKYVNQRTDTNNDCKVDANDSAASYDFYTHIDATGVKHNRISVVSQYFNNRRSNTLFVVAVVGSLLSDKLLIDRAERGVKEWLKYAVYPDGTEGEYARNGDYCIPHQGRVYAMSNINAALVIAEIMSRRGDSGLYNYSTREGLYGTESGTSDAPKSINNYVKNYFDLISKKKNIYYYEPWKETQEPRELTHLGRVINGYLNGTRMIHNWHDLSLLSYVTKVNNTEWAKIVLRNAESGMPSLIANPNINSGISAYKDHGTSDTVAAFPSVLFMHTPAFIKEVPKSAILLDLSISSPSFKSGESIDLTWVSQGALSCEADGSWSGYKKASGTQKLYPESDSTYMLTCSNKVSTINKKVVVKLIIPAITPNVTPPVPPIAIVPTATTTAILVATQTAAIIQGAPLLTIQTKETVQRTATPTINISSNLKANKAYSTERIMRTLPSRKEISLYDIQNRKETLIDNGSDYAHKEITAENKTDFPWNFMRYLRSYFGL